MLRLYLPLHEIEKWGKLVREKGVTLVPLEIYFKDARVKLKLALARGKKLYDKRQTERDKADKRQIERALGRRR
jgi:SsrA-binding protein